MNRRIIFSLVLLALACRAEGAMARFAGVVDGRTIAVERNGVREEVRLAGIIISSEVHARSLLQWTLADAWVMLEKRGDGFLIYRSPDALFINRELVLRGFAQATLAEINPQPRPLVTYLGVVQPFDPPATAKDDDEGTTSRSRTRSGMRRRSSASPSRRASRPPRSSENADASRRRK